MKKNLNRALVFVVALFLVGCPTYDPPDPGPSFIYNCSDQAVYVYHSADGRLGLEPRLLLFESRKMQFEYEKSGCESLLQPPPYRINAYEHKEVDNPYTGIDYVDNDTLHFFFISEQTMRINAWDTIVGKGLYQKRISIAKSDYFGSHSVLTYVPVR